MYKFYVGYRFQNGEVMGFIGEGLSKMNARINSHNKIIAKLKQIEESFDESRVLESLDSIAKLSVQEMAIIKADWDYAKLNQK